MGGGLMQLVAYGAQDVYLTGNPQITFFKVVYRRHTNFSMEAIEQTFNGQPGFGRRVTCTISRNGDLVHKMYLRATVPRSEGTAGNAAWVSSLGEKLVKSVELEIGGQRIDKHYGDWLHIWNELSMSSQKRVSYDEMIGNVGRLTQKTVAAGDFYVMEETEVTEQNIINYGEYRIDGEFMLTEDGDDVVTPIISMGAKIIIQQKVGAAFEAASTFGDDNIPDEVERDVLYLVDASKQELITKVLANALSGERRIVDTVDVSEFSNLTVGSISDAYCHDDCSSASQQSGVVSLCTPKEQLFVPLQFWFNRNPGLALPLIALQYHEVKLNVEFERKEALVASGVYGDLEAADLLVDYIFLDTDERRRFAQVSHEYLIEQLQFTGDESTDSANPKIKLNFNHPCKELVWTVQPTERRGCTAAKDMFNYAVAAPVTGHAEGNMVRSAKLQLNGHDRFSEQPGKYFDVVQPYQHHTATPARGINVYSFGLKPEEHQPSGTCNMSRIDNATLNLSLAAAALSGSGSSATVRVYATNYNVLRVMSGMGGLAYAN